MYFLLLLQFIAIFNTTYPGVEGKKLRYNNENILF